TGVKERALHFPGEEVILLSPGGDAVATKRDGRIRLWDTVAGRLLRSLNGASTEMMALAFSPDGRTLVSSHLSGEDGVVALWPTRLGEEISAVRVSSIEGRAILFDRDGSRFYACASRDAGAWDPQGRRQQWKYVTDGRLIEHLAV